MKFIYRPGSEGGLFPIVNFKAKSKSNFIDVSALIDSGATISIFKLEVADFLGIDIRNGEETFLRGVAGRIQGYIHNVTILIAGKTITIPIVFSKEYSVSFNILGRNTFFDSFKIIFDEKNKVVELI